MSTTIITGIYRVSEWISRLALVNLLWLLFSLIGFGILGFFPSTVAMYSIVRKWVQGEDDFPIFRTFWKAYKAEFVRSNTLGIFFILISYFTFINAKFLLSKQGLMADTISVFYISFILLMIVVVLYIFPVYSHFKIKTLEYIKFAFIIGITHPLITGLMVIATLFFYYITLLLPGVALFFVGSALSLVHMWLANSIFVKLDNKELQASKTT